LFDRAARAGASAMTAGTPNSVAGA